MTWSGMAWTYLELKLEMDVEKKLECATGEDTKSSG